jgi:hypothetical protein
MTNCPIWGTPAVELAGGEDGRKIDSKRAGGVYRIAGTALAMVSGLTDAEKAKLTTWIVDQHLAGDGAPLITSDIVSQARARRGLRYSESKDRLFRALYREGFRPSQHLAIWGVVDDEVRETVPKISALIESHGDRDTSSFMGMLIKEGLFEQQGATGRLTLTPKGYERLDEVSVGGAPTDQAFVAMWFSKELDQAYSAIDAAVWAAGYRSLRIDQKEHANKIDDEIISEIRRSRFLVADFTCGTYEADGKPRSEPRGGVYYEAGFAQGLGIPVVWTVRADQIGLVHFDTRQYSHIAWNTPEDLRDRLISRIRAVIGQGPN